MRQICNVAEEGPLKACVHSKANHTRAYFAGIPMEGVQLVKVAVGIARDEADTQSPAVSGNGVRLCWPEAKSKVKRELRLERERKECRARIRFSVFVFSLSSEEQISKALQPGARSGSRGRRRSERVTQPTPRLARLPDST